MALILLTLSSAAELLHWALRARRHLSKVFRMFIKIAITDAMHDGLGFAARQFSEVLRVAWFPLLVLFAAGLLLNLFVIPNLDRQDPSAQLVALALYVPVAVIVNATVMVTLIRMAVTGHRIHHRSLHFAFGPREILFLLASLGSILFVAVLSFGPMMYLQVLIEGFAQEREVQTAFFFTEGSLHEGSESLIFADGHPVRQWMPFVMGAGYLALIYLALRLFMLPVFIAAQSATPLKSALAASAGVNALRLVLLFLVFILVQFTADFSAQLVAQLAFAVGGLVSMAVNALAAWGLDFATPVWATNAQFAVAMFVSAIFAIVTQAFTLGLFAGFAGGVARQVESR